MFKKCLLLLPLLVLGILPLRAQTASFSFQHFDVPDSASTEADNINARGEIVGFFVDHADRQHGFFYCQGAFT